MAEGFHRTLYQKEGVSSDRLTPFSCPAGNCHNWQLTFSTRLRIRLQGSRTRARGSRGVGRVRGRFSPYTLSLHQMFAGW